MVNVGDIQKYIPTSTVGKVTDVKEMEGKVWAKLDFTNLYYDVEFLKPADKSEYKAVSYKEREKSSVSTREGTEKILDDLRQAEDEVDISDYTPSGGG